MADRLLILDANVLIDYVQSDPGILSLTAQHLGSVFVVESVLEEVQSLGRDLCRELGLVVVEPNLHQLAEATAGPPASLSFQDRLCLILARDLDLTCVSNDRRLRSECKAQEIEVLWGLELMVQLVDCRVLPRAKAIGIVRQIQANNPFHIHDGVVDRFLSRIGA